MKIRTLNQSGKPHDSQLQTAVYVEDVKALTDEIVALIRARTEHVPEGHLRKAIIGAALITAAQDIDGLSLPVLWKRGGITSMIRHIADKWTRCGSSN